MTGIPEAWQVGVTMAMGGMIVLSGLYWIYPISVLRLDKIKQSLSRYMAPCLSWSMRFRGGYRGLLLGLATALLPCGWLYSFVLVAAATGHPVWGMCSMAVFWLGTVPALTVGQWFWTRGGRHMPPVFQGILLVLLGITMMVMRVMPVLEGGGKTCH